MGEQVINLNFTLNGARVLEPLNWGDTKEVYEFGTNSNQPAIETESFTFQADGAKKIFDHISPNGVLGVGNMLVPIDLNVTYTQNGTTAVLMEDYILDPTDNLEYNDNSFNGEFIPNEVICSVSKKDGSDYFLTEIQGLTWELLREEGLVKNSDLKTIKTAVVPLYSFLDVAFMLLTIYSLQKQLRDAIESSRKSILDTSNRLSEGALTGLGAGLFFSTIFVVLKTALEIAGALLLLALLVKSVLDIIVVLVPPILKNKGITLRRGMEIICKKLDYNFSCDIAMLDQVVYMPSNTGSQGHGIIKNNFPSWFANERGVPNSYDNGYLASQFVEIVKQLVNGVVDLKNKTVILKSEDDPSLFKIGNYKHNIPVKYQKLIHNIRDIPHTRLIEFATDESEGYTREYQKGRLYEVKNISKKGNLPFKKGEFINIPCSLAHRKDKLLPLEKIIVTMAGVADGLASLLGKNTKMKEKIKNNRIGIVAVTRNDFSNPKLVPIIAGNVPSNYKDILSAETIEKRFYKNRSIVRGAGQKLILPDIELPMSLADMQDVKNNKNFIDPTFGKCKFERVETSYSSDKAICDISIESNYLAPNTFEEKTYDGF